jgi:WD40 repeat protein
MTAILANRSDGFYVVGGTMRHDAPSYVERAADKELFSALMRNEYCHVLTARQMGKSSLMLRAAASLRESGVGVAVLDLTAIGQNLTAEQWYGGLMIQLGDRLDLEDDLLEFWSNQTLVGPMQRWVNAIRKVVLPRYPGRLVVFIDEIDAVRSLNFSTDELFAGIRECYNLRNEDVDIQRLTFCLLGVATPSDLIRDTRTTPFNVGRRVELNDFTEEEASVLAQGLPQSPQQNKALLKRVLYWTGGHPYLTQRVCQALVENKTGRSARDADHLINELFFSKRAQEYDDNLIFVRERILRSGADLPALLNLYSKVRRGKSVPDDDSNPLVSILRLSGVTRTENGMLRVRNRIYKRVFNKAWVTSNLPDLEARRQREAYRRGVWRTSAVSAIILALVVGLATVAVRQRNRALEQADVNRRLLYMAQMKLADQEWENSNLSRVEELLKATCPLPDEADLRGFEWSLFWNYIHGEVFRLQEPHPIATAEFLQGKNILAIAVASHAMIQFKREYVIKLYDQDADRETISFAVPAGKNFDVVSFSPDLKYVATDSPDRTLTLWDLNSGENVRVFKPAHQRAITTVAFARGKPYLASVDTGGELKIWDIATGKERLTRNIGRSTWGLAFSPDGRLLAITTRSRAVQFLETDTGRVLRPFVIEEGSLSQASFSPDGTRLAAITQDGRLYFCDVNKRRMIPPMLSHTSEIISLAFSPDGKTLATGSLDRTVKLWNVTTGRELRTIRAHGSKVNSVGWSFDGKLLVTGGSEGTVKVWDVFTQALPVLPDQPVKSYRGTIFSSTAELMALGVTFNSHVKIWNLSTGQELSDLGEGGDKILCVAFSNDGEMVAIGSTDQFVKIREVRTGKVISTLTGFNSVRGLCFSPDGKTIISDTDQGNLILWEVSSGRELASLNSGNSSYCAVFSPDGKLLASADQDGSVKLWDLASLRVIKTLTGHASTVRIIAFSPDVRLVATGADDNTIRLWDIAAGEGLPQKVQSDAIRRIAFTPDGKRLVSGGKDGSVTLWSVKDLQEIIALRGPKSEVTSVSFSKNGTTLAVSRADGTVKVWQAANIEELDARSR